MNGLPMLVFSICPAPDHLPGNLVTIRSLCKNMNALPTYYLLTCLITYLLTHSKDHSPSWEANRSSASEEISRILWNLKARCHILKCPPPVPILSQINPVHTPTSHFLKIHLNINLPSTSGSPKRSHSPQVSPPKPCICLSSPPIHSTCPAHIILLYHPNNMGWGVQIIKLLIMWFISTPLLHRPS